MNFLTPNSGNDSRQQIQVAGPGAQALQQGDVLLASDCAGVMRVDHFHAGASVARQCQQVARLAGAKEGLQLGSLPGCL